MVVDTTKITVRFSTTSSSTNRASIILINDEPQAPRTTITVTIIPKNDTSRNPGLPFPQLPETKKDTTPKANHLTSGVGTHPDWQHTDNVSSQSDKEDNGRVTTARTQRISNSKTTSPSHNPSTEYPSALPQPASSPTGSLPITKDNRQGISSPPADVPRQTSVPAKPGKKKEVSSNTRSNVQAPSTTTTKVATLSKDVPTPKDTDVPSEIETKSKVPSLAVAKQQEPSQPTFRLNIPHEDLEAQEKGISLRFGDVNGIVTSYPQLGPTNSPMGKPLAPAAKTSNDEQTNKKSVIGAPTVSTFASPNLLKLSSPKEAGTTSVVKSEASVGNPPNAEQTIQNSIGAAPTVLTLDSSSNKSPVISQDYTPEQASSSQKPGTTSDVNSQVPVGKPPNAEQSIQNSIGAAPTVLTLDSSSNKSPVISQDYTSKQASSSQKPGTTSDMNSQVPVGNPPNAEQTVQNSIGAAPTVLTLDSSSNKSPVISQDYTPEQASSSQKPVTTSDVNSQAPVAKPPNAEQTILNSIGAAPTVLTLDSASNKSPVISQDYTPEHASSSQKPVTTSDVNSQAPVAKPPNAEQTILNSIEQPPLNKSAADNQDYTSKHASSSQKSGTTSDVNSQAPVAKPPNAEQTIQNSIEAAPAVLTLDSASNKSAADNQDYTSKQASSSQKPGTTSDVNSQAPVAKPPNAEQTIQNSIEAAPAVLTLDSSSNKSPADNQDYTSKQASSSQKPGTTSDVNSQVPVGKPPNAEQTIQNSIGAAPTVLTLDSSSNKSPAISQDNTPEQASSSQKPDTTSDVNSQAPVANPPNAEQTILNSIGAAPAVLTLDSASKKSPAISQDYTPEHASSSQKPVTTSDVNSQAPVAKPPNAEQTIQNSIEAAPAVLTLDSASNKSAQASSSQKPGTTSDVNSQAPVAKPPNAEQTIQNSIEAAPAVLTLDSSSNKSAVISQDYTL
ncbi:hypothetical protein DSO57_1001891 [Entomophthora muscae]|uniref:Uncharacterized protein n=1 Tax=Entomophthora muscae TaxID=34485 RepID=A0ACC2TKL9_9FUNG|nr:hypothetical protein DSO57_1001891 [Entomophthora muscae]